MIDPPGLQECRSFPQEVATKFVMHRVQLCGEVLLVLSADQIPKR